MSETYNCEKCGAENIRPFSSYADPRKLCESCAMDEYKAKYPLTWDRQLLKVEFSMIRMDVV